LRPDTPLMIPRPSQRLKRTAESNLRFILSAVIFLFATVLFLSCQKAEKDLFLKIGLPEEPRSLNLWLGTDANSRKILSLIYQPLYNRHPETLEIIPWLAAAAHEVPQELGDFAVLVNGGWSKAGALLYNFLSALTFLVGGLVAYSVSATIQIDFMIPFAAGNFLYIGAADLIPEIKQESDFRKNLIHFSAFTSGLGILLIIRLLFPHES